MFRMNHQHVQAARLLTHTYGATIPAEACVNEEHWIAEPDLCGLNQVEAAVASMSHTARAGKMFPIMITKVPCIDAVRFLTKFEQTLQTFCRR
jgi:hypothetical protein